MKWPITIITVTGLILFSLTTSGQKSTCHDFTSSELMQMANMSYSNFDTKVTGNCFRAFEVDTTNGITKRKYEFSGDTYNGMMDLISYQSGVYGKTIVYWTMDEKKYSKIKTEVSSMPGFKQTDEHSDTNMSWFTYENDKYLFDFILNFGEGKYLYSIKIKRK